jgi:uncharacterized membrane protein YeaQ/YmgE (transglycosylase-associated protein family)
MAKDAGRQGVGEIREASSLPESGLEGSRRGRWIRWLLVCALAGILASQLSARAAKEGRPTRVVSGVVSDASENPISGAVVTLKDLKEGKEMATYTGQSGTYQFSGLEITRDYEVQASYKGVSSRVRRVSMIDPRSRIVLNLRIPPPKDEE